MGEEATSQVRPWKSISASRHRLHSSQVLGRPQVSFSAIVRLLFQSSFRATSFREVLLAPHSKRSSASDLVCEANTKHKEG